MNIFGIHICWQEIQATQDVILAAGPVLAVILNRLRGWVNL